MILTYRKDYMTAGKTATIREDMQVVKQGTENLCLSDLVHEWLLKTSGGSIPPLPTIYCQVVEWYRQ